MTIDTNGCHMGNGRIKKTTPPRRIVLVGTYKGDQLKDWPGWYCWPLGKDDLKCCQCENVANGQSQLPMQSMGQLATGNNGNGNTSTMATLSAVTELWLFQGTKEQRNYRAEFVGVKTREELIRDFAATLAANHPDTNVVNDDRVWKAA